MVNPQPIKDVGILVEEFERMCSLKVMFGSPFTAVKGSDTISRRKTIMHDKKTFDLVSTLQKSLVDQYGEYNLLLEFFMFAKYMDADRRLDTDTTSFFGDGGVMCVNVPATIVIGKSERKCRINKLDALESDFARLENDLNTTTAVYYGSMDPMNIVFNKRMINGQRFDIKFQSLDVQDIVPTALWDLGYRYSDVYIPQQWMREPYLQGGVYYSKELKPDARIDVLVRCKVYKNKLNEFQ